MSTLLETLAACIERGKVNKDAPYPPDMKGQDGSDELTAKALEEKIDPNDILTEGLMKGMGLVGEKFGRNEVFVPDLLMAARAMSAAMAHLKPYFDSGAAQRKGKIIIGTVQGDLHDIGKNLVGMVMEGGGWEVIDLGVDVTTEQFMEAVEANPDCVVGLSALLTTTMINMEKTVNAIKGKDTNIKILLGGAPLSQEFCDKIGADAYAPDPQKALNYLTEACA